MWYFFVLIQISYVVFRWLIKGRERKLNIPLRCINKLCINHILSLKLNLAPWHYTCIINSNFLMYIYKYSKLICIVATYFFKINIIKKNITPGSFYAVKQTVRMIKPSSLQGQQIFWNYKTLNTAQGCNFINRLTYVILHNVAIYIQYTYVA